MADYAELVKKLREFASIPAHCENVASCDDCTKEEICLSFTNERIVKITNAAADAIEDLEFACNRYEKDYKALCAYLPKWIPVTERLPKHDTDVLCWICPSSPGMDGYCVCGVHTGESWLMDAEWVETERITHWMPLPTPPKEETE